MSKDYVFYFICSMPRRFRIGRVCKNYGRMGLKESLSNESSKTSTQGSSPTGSSLSTENVNPIVDNSSHIGVNCHSVSTNCDMEVVQESEQSSFNNSTDF